ncbi:MAG: hypothetical protein WC346_05925 [Methanogenium sp.]|jgi:hypothetical protein
MLQTPDNFQYARSAIRDIFYQMPSRTLLIDLWPRYLNEIYESLGEEYTKAAIEDLKKSGYLTFEKSIVKWKDPITLATIQEGAGFKSQYGCLMLELDIEDWDRMLAMIDTDDIYDTTDHGLEYYPHTTVLFGFLPEVTIEDIKAAFNKLRISQQITLKVLGISHFNGVDCDIVKFDVQSPYLNKLHDYFKQLPNAEKFSDYHPHITLAYVKSGTGQKYDHLFSYPMVLKSRTFNFSDVNKNSSIIKV